MAKRRPIKRKNWMKPPVKPAKKLGTARFQAQNQTIETLAGRIMRIDTLTNTERLVSRFKAEGDVAHAVTELRRFLPRATTLKARLEGMLKGLGLTELQIRTAIDRERMLFLKRKEIESEIDALTKSKESIQQVKDKAKKLVDELKSLRATHPLKL